MEIGEVTNMKNFLVVCFVIFFVGLFLCFISNLIIHEKLEYKKMKEKWPDGLIVQHLSSNERGIVVGRFHPREVRVRFGLNEPKWFKEFELKPEVESKETE